MKKEVKRFIEKAIKYNAEVLGIGEPRVVYVGKALMGTETTQAETSNTGDEIKINRDCGWGTGSGWREWVFCVMAHEVRHCWQVLTGYSNKALRGYKSSSEISIERYNEQELEIDAWAWAWFMLKVNYGMDLILGEEVMSKKAQDDIKEREKRMEREFLNKR